MADLQPSIRNDMSFRILRPIDAQDLVDLRHRAIQECPEAFGTAPAIELARKRPFYKRKLLQLKWNPHEDLLGLWHNESLIGMAGFGRRCENRQTYGVLVYSIFVDKEFRGFGLGTGLLEEAIQASLPWHPEWAKLTVECGNKHAIARYEAKGFQIEQTEHHAFRIDGRWYDVFHMRKALTSHA